MGYDLHITRRSHWVEPGNDITREEFIAAVASDPSFKRPSQLGEDYVEWRDAASGYESWLCWTDGQIETKNPEEPLIARMIELATRLGAVVQGDDGEVYPAAPAKTAEPKKPWWRLW